MKQRLKGLLALVLSLMMVLSMVTVSTASQPSDSGSAPTEYHVSVGGTKVTSANAANVLSDGKVSYDPDTNTLTLNNFTMVDNSHYEAISSDQDLTLNLIGDNEITASYGSGAVAVSVTGKLAIEGTGSLTADGTYRGLSASSGVDISGGKVTAEGYVYGIISSTGNVSITGGEVEATGRDSGINANNITITGGTVNATGSAEYGYGIYAHESNSNGGDIVISNGNVTAEGGRVGIGADDAVTITGGTVIAKGTTPTDSVGIHASGRLGGELTISGANTKVSVGCKTGLDAGTVNIAGGIVTINSTEDAISSSATLNLGTGSRWYKWTDDKNATTMNDSDFALSAYNGNPPAYLKFEPLTYTVKFDANGGSGTMADATGVSGNYTLPANGFDEPVGDEFFGWSVDPAGAERKHPGETMQITKDTTVYAIWKYATLGNQGGGYPGTPQPPSIYIPTVEDEPEVTAPNTFDGGIASAVVVTILSATGGAWLAKKKD